MFTIRTQEPLPMSAGHWVMTKHEGSVIEHVYKNVGNYTATAFVRSQSGTVVKDQADTRDGSLVLNDLTFSGKPSVQGRHGDRGGSVEPDHHTVHLPARHQFSVGCAGRQRIQRERRYADGNLS